MRASACWDRFKRCHDNLSPLVLPKQPRAEGLASRPNRLYLPTPVLDLPLASNPTLYRLLLNSSRVTLVTSPDLGFRCPRPIVPVSSFCTKARIDSDFLQNQPKKDGLVRQITENRAANHLCSNSRAVSRASIPVRSGTCASAVGLVE